ncbi:MAG: PadR family transcriptional regulator [Candidatus Marinimicrobia bacterium]|nr:PadR family transcriptional regulator [Candidatus Neomarinimicrobiota bacterium]
MKSEKLKMTILGLIARESNHAYQLEKIIDQEDLRAGMEIGFSTIYSTLKKLESGGYLKSEISTQENLPSRKIYSITYAGKEYLRKVLKQSLFRPEFNYSKFDLALLFGDLIPKEEFLEALDVYKVEINRRIKEIIDELTATDSEQAYKKIILNRRLELLKAEKKWLKELYI